MTKRDYKSWDKDNLIQEIESLRKRKKYGLVWVVKCFMSTNEEYNPILNTWATKADMTTARQNLTSSVAN